MDERYSWVIRFERRDGKPEEERYFDTETEAREAFREYDDDDNAEIYDSIELVKIDWHWRCDSRLDSIAF